MSDPYSYTASRQPEPIAAAEFEMPFAGQAIGVAHERPPVASMVETAAVSSSPAKPHGRVSTWLIGGGLAFYLVVWTLAGTFTEMTAASYLAAVWAELWLASSVTGIYAFATRRPTWLRLGAGWRDGLLIWALSIVPFVFFVIATSASNGA